MVLIRQDVGAGVGEGLKALRPVEAQINTEIG
jgi:hypothetical protein